MMTTFISYAHETVAYTDKVRLLADRLRTFGIDVDIDQYNAHPREGWPKWMERRMSSDLLLLALSPRYVDAFNGQSKPGAAYEGAIVSSRLLRNGVDFSKIAVVLFDPYEGTIIPEVLLGCQRYFIDRADGFDNLYRFLTSQPYVKKPHLGNVVILPARNSGGVETSETNVPDVLHFGDLCRALLPILEENRRIFVDFGPRSGKESTGSVRWELSLWYSQRPRIASNNARIAQLIQTHRPLIPERYKGEFDQLLSHIEAFAAHVNDDGLDYREHQFPQHVSRIIIENAD
jgi:hypothetical protein